MKYILISIVTTILHFWFDKPLNIHVTGNHILPLLADPVMDRITDSLSLLVNVFPTSSTSESLIDRIYYLYVDDIEELDPKKQTLIWIFANMCFVFVSVYVALLAARLTWTSIAKPAAEVWTWFRGRLRRIVAARTAATRGWARTKVAEGTKSILWGSRTLAQNLPPWLWYCPIANIFRRRAAEFSYVIHKIPEAQLCIFILALGLQVTECIVMMLAYLVRGTWLYCSWICELARSLQEGSIRYTLGPKRHTAIALGIILYHCFARFVDPDHASLFWKVPEMILVMVVLALYLLTICGPYRLLGITPLEMQVRQHALAFEDLIRRHGLHMVLRILNSMDPRAECILMAELSSVDRLPHCPPGYPTHLSAVDWEETIAYKLGLAAAREYGSLHPIMTIDAWTRDDRKFGGREDHTVVADEDPEGLYAPPTPPLQE
ncbi:uncharacterized protein BKCO1_26000136 [Diplodia corticola]|uniref:Uncharacterized protein n=1 Tax=Diplodia corticola TaxID=236234 RepID=A0A1J9RMW1_9PEZI|nr:uncharacterized protein BKCO1_26000136 [Diplodia corticola]OJD33907.1 hypothetical protein BKCO1_26000136 [Diplodia corticola]